MAAEPLGAVLPLWSVAPFVVLLVAVAVLELVAQRLVGQPRATRPWSRRRWPCRRRPPRRRPWSAGVPRRWAHSLTDYVSFIVLLTALFVIAGGIEVKGSLAGTPLANMVMLGIGAVLANLIGTTGASMVLIRPYLRANARRRHKAHLVVFFILDRRQRRRPADAARRPAAVPRLPQGRAVRVDPRAVGAVAVRQRGRPGRLQPGRPVRGQPGGAGRAATSACWTS